MFHLDFHKMLNKPMALSKELTDGQRELVNDIKIIIPSSEQPGHTESYSTHRIKPLSLAKNCGKIFPVTYWNY